MRKFLVVLLLVVVGLLVAADFGARAAAADQLRQRLAREVPSSTSTSVDIDSFPFLGRLLISGHLSTLHAAVTDVDAGPIRLARVRVELHDVRINRNALLNERKVLLESISGGTATAEITQEELSDALGLPVELGDGKIAVRAGPLRAAASVSVQDNVLRVNAGPVSVPALRIPKIPLLPCVANAQVQEGRIAVSCTIDTVPPELIEAVRSRA